MDMYEKLQRILVIAQKDFSYLAWQKTFQEAEEDFEAFANSQPLNVQTILWNYAHGGRMMNQRLVNLACEYMDFPEE